MTTDAQTTPRQARQVVARSMVHASYTCSRDADRARRTAPCVRERSESVDEDIDRPVPSVLQRGTLYCLVFGYNLWKRKAVELDLER